jgi:hypothetical protein
MGFSGALIASELEKLQKYEELQVPDFTNLNNSLFI